MYQCESIILSKKNTFCPSRLQVDFIPNFVPKFEPHYPTLPNFVPKLGYPQLTTTTPNFPTSNPTSTVLQLPTWLGFTFDWHSPFSTGLQIFSKSSSRIHPFVLSNIQNKLYIINVHSKCTSYFTSNFTSNFTSKSSSNNPFLVRKKRVSVKKKMK